jgi:G3E family GTPase
MIHAFVITGFLGVGKTTMLTHTVKEHFSDKKIAIVVNEFGDVGVDSKILTNVHSEVLEISEGCICCKLAQEFESGVLEIIGKYQPDILFVETSGASEPFPIFLSLQNLGICVEGVICVADAKNFTAYKENNTAKYQLGGANIIVINKSDLVSESELHDVKQDITQIKEQYNIKNNLTGETIFNNYMLVDAQQGLVNPEVFEGIYRAGEIGAIAKEYTHENHTANDALSQKVAYINETIDFSTLEAILKALPTNIYRLKGVVRTSDVTNPLFVNYAFGDVSYEELESYQEQSLLVFIGESIENDVGAICEKFACLHLPRFRVVKR